MNERFNRMMNKKSKILSGKGKWWEGRLYDTTGVLDFDTIHEYPRQATIKIRDIMSICITHIDEASTKDIYYVVLIYIIENIPLRN
jgi:hypothetical protein